MSQPPRKRRQSYHQATNVPLAAAPFPIPSSPPAITTSRPRPLNSHMVTPPPPRAQPHPTYPPQLSPNAPPINLPPWLPPQHSQIRGPPRPRSQPPPSERQHWQSDAQPPLPSAPSRPMMSPRHTAQAAAQPVTNWCTRLKNYSEALNKTLSHEEFQVDTRRGRMCVFRYFLNGVQYSESVGPTMKDTRRDAARQAYEELSKEEEEKQWRYQPPARY